MYTGEFTGYRNVLLNPVVVELVKKQLIEDVFLDTTLISSSEFNLLTEACDSVKAVLRQVLHSEQT